MKSDFTLKDILISYKLYFHATIFIIKNCFKVLECTGLTFKKRADFSPTCDSTLTGVLAQRYLQEEEGDATGEQKQNIRYEENPFKKKNLVKIKLDTFVHTNNDF